MNTQNDNIRQRSNFYLRLKDDVLTWIFGGSFTVQKIKPLDFSGHIKYVPLKFKEIEQRTLRVVVGRAVSAKRMPTRAGIRKTRRGKGRRMLRGGWISWGRLDRRNAVARPGAFRTLTFADFAKAQWYPRLKIGERPPTWDDPNPYGGVRRIEWSRPIDTVWDVAYWNGSMPVQGEGQSTQEWLKDIAWWKDKILRRKGAREHLTFHSRFSTWAELDAWVDTGKET